MSETVKIKIVRGFIHDRKDLLPGEVHEVPAIVAQREIAAGCAVKATEKDVAAAKAKTEKVEK
jgi:hypothetical protein